MRIFSYFQHEIDEVATGAGVHMTRMGVLGVRVREPEMILRVVLTIPCRPSTSLWFVNPVWWMTSIMGSVRVWCAVKLPPLQASVYMCRCR